MPQPPTPPPDLLDAVPLTEQQVSDWHEWREIRCNCCIRPHLLYRRRGTCIEIVCRHGKHLYYFDIVATD